MERIPASIVRTANVSQSTIGSVGGSFLSAANSEEDLPLNPVQPWSRVIFLYTPVLPLFC